MEFCLSNQKAISMHTSYLLLGGNKGDVLAIFREALRMFPEAGLQVVAQSSIYQSEPWGMDNTTPWFYNQVIKVRTNKKAAELLNAILDIEKALGRSRKPGIMDSRTIDIDILLFNNAAIAIPGLVIPHPRMHLRRFALTPLHEIAPGMVHPVLKQTVRQLLTDCKDSLRVEKTTVFPDSGNQMQNTSQP